jgi:hypothetical protein
VQPARHQSILAILPLPAWLASGLLYGQRGVDSVYWLGDNPVKDAAGNPL